MPLEEGRGLAGLFGDHFEVAVENGLGVLDDLVVFPVLLLIKVIGIGYIGLR